MYLISLTINAIHSLISSLKLNCNVHLYKIYMYSASHKYCLLKLFTFTRSNRSKYNYFDSWPCKRHFQVKRHVSSIHSIDFTRMHFTTQSHLNAILCHIDWYYQWATAWQFLWTPQQPFYSWFYSMEPFYKWFRNSWSKYPKMFCFYMENNNKAGSWFCTWHDRSAAVPYAKL